MKFYNHRQLDKLSYSMHVVWNLDSKLYWRSINMLMKIANKHDVLKEFLIQKLQFKKFEVFNWTYWIYSQVATTPARLIELQWEDSSNLTMPKSNWTIKLNFQSSCLFEKFDWRFLKSSASIWFIRKHAC